MQNRMNAVLKNSTAQKQKLSINKPTIKRVKKTTFLQVHPIIFSCALCAITMLLFVFLHNIASVSETTFKINKLEKQLKILQSTAIHYRSILEEKFETAKIKKYAIKKLHMKELNENFVNFLPIKNNPSNSNNPQKNSAKPKNNLISFLKKLIPKTLPHFNL